MIEDQNSELAKLTLVMATCRRQSHAIRNMRYWSNTGVVLLVLDDSPSPIKESVLNSLGNNIIYKHDSSEYSKRIVSGFSAINTKYTQLINDDEFYIISSVISCIRELEKNESIISCMGCCLGFIVDKKTKKIYSRPVYEQLTNNYKLTMEDDEVKRLNDYVTNYIPFLMFAMIRTDIWKKAFEIPVKFNTNKTKKYKFEKFNFFSSDENQINMYLGFAGKSKVIRELYWLRSYGEHPTIRDAHEDLPEPEMSIEEWWNSSNEREQFIQIMSDSFEKTGIKTKLSYNDIVIEWYNSFIKGGGGDLKKSQLFFIKHKHGIKRFYLLNFFNYLNRLIPRRIKNIIKSSVLWKYRQTTFLEGVNLLANRGIKVDNDSLLKIQKIIYNFHKN
jgi:glycosyltransferase domain-containing protein